MELIVNQVSRNGSDTPTSNRRPSISTSREILNLTEKTLRLRSIWRGWTRETPWIWHRGYSRHRDREFIFSLSRELRVFIHLHLMLIFIPIFIWTGRKSGRVLFKRTLQRTPPLFNLVRWPSSRRWTWKKAINFGWRLVIVPDLCFCMTTVTTTPISRVSCWRRKLSRPFEVKLHRRRTTHFRHEHILFHVDTKFWGGREF